MIVQHLHQLIISLKTIKYTFFEIKIFVLYKLKKLADIYIFPYIKAKPKLKYFPNF
jgi:hypothetical protein